MLKIDNFSRLNGWLDRFKQRHDDEGMIRYLKRRYRRLLVARFVQYLDSNNTTSVTVLDAIHLLHSAWSQVTPATISNCFGHAFESNVSIPET